MTSKEKLLQLRHDFYTSDSLDYDSISYFTAIEKDLKIAEFVKDYVNSTKTTYSWSYSKQLEFFYTLEKLVKELENEK